MRTLAAGLGLTLLFVACAADVHRSAPPSVPVPHVALPVKPPEERGPRIVSRSAPTEMSEQSVRSGRTGSKGRHSDLSRLRTVARERRNLDPANAYTLGPGDVIAINVFGLDELNRTVRVSQRSEIQLPLIGGVPVGGRSEAEVAQQIASRLRKDYLQDPQVDVFVEEYRSQQVAVTGAVANPGLVSLTRDRYGILDVISEAGGLTRDAGSFIEFIPASRRGKSRAFETMRRAASGNEIQGQGIQIEIDDLMRGAGNEEVDVTVIAGDVIYVPESGSFSIDGWVEAPGTYPLTRGMTVLGALASAGGPLFPAALSRVELLRTTSATGQAREVVEIDVNAVKEGRQADVALRGGDVVRIPGNPLLMPPWALYSLVRDFFRIGAGVPIT